MEIKREMFPEYWISLRGGDLNWLSPNPLTISLGYLKTEVFKHRPKTLEDRHTRINHRNPDGPVGKSDINLVNSFKRLYTKAKPSFGRYNFQNLNTTYRRKFRNKIFA